jgi:hypothetical protein
MRCEKVLGQLSLFLDNMIEENLAGEVSRHLRACSNCGVEFDRLHRLREALRSLRPVEAPDYLHSLVGVKISNALQISWSKSLQSAWEYRWSRVRTTGGLWYMTRFAGAVATVVFFIAICSAVNPMYLGFSRPMTERAGASPAVFSPQKISDLVLDNLGLRPLKAQKKPISSSEPKINDLYLLNMGQKALGTHHDDTVSVVAHIDRSGAGTVQDVLEYPFDDSLLSEFTDMIMSAGWRPASQNGRAVDSRLVLTFSKIYVYN